jgi:hypothetical protein
MLTRRQFLQAALVSGAAAAVPPVLESFLDAARASTTSSATSGYYLDATRWATCQALCARIVPTGSDPLTDPGAYEAKAVVFIDRFLSAFELPTGVADNPAIYVHGQNSGRNPYPNGEGGATGDYPTDGFLDGSLGKFLSLTPVQELSWRCQIYGTAALADAPAWAAAWAKQVGGLVPAPAGYRQLYADGLDAFNSYSESLFKVPFASASTEDQDVMLDVAGNLVLSALPISLPGPVGPPAAATALVSAITLHTFQATYGIPEYSWRNQSNDPTVERLGGTSQWRAIDYTGDTQPLGNSVFDADLHGPGEGPNAGFGEEGVFVPFGGYREYRPVSTLGTGGTALAGEIVYVIKEALVQGGQSSSTRSTKGAL